MKLGQIFEGWKNHLAPDEYLLEQITTVSNERLAICNKCPLNSIIAGPVNSLRFDFHCTACGCTLSAKTKCLSCSCPENKWTSVISSEEEQIIKDNEAN